MPKSAPRSRAIAISAEQPFDPFHSMLAVVLGSLGLWTVVLSLGFAMARML
jgi:hypothetical protein